jgi:hypothetical protein
MEDMEDVVLAVISQIEEEHPHMHDREIRSSQFLKMLLQRLTLRFDAMKREAVAHIEFEGGAVMSALEVELVTALKEEAEKSFSTRTRAADERAFLDEMVEREKDDLKLAEEKAESKKATRAAEERVRVAEADERAQEEALRLAAAQVLSHPMHSHAHACPPSCTFTMHAPPSCMHHMHAHHACSPLMHAPHARSPCMLPPHACSPCISQSRRL